MLVRLTPNWLSTLDRPAVSLLDTGMTQAIFFVSLRCHLDGLTAGLTVKYRDEVA